MQNVKSYPTGSKNKIWRPKYVVLSFWNIMEKKIEIRSTSKKVTLTAFWDLGCFCIFLFQSKKIHKPREK